MHTRPAVSANLGRRSANLGRRSAILGRRGVVVSVSVAAVGLLVSLGGVAGAVPQPTIGQVQQRLQQLNNQANKLGQQYDQVLQEYASANQRLTLVNKEAARYGARFEAMRAQMAQIAATAYEEGNVTSTAALLTSSNPQQILNQSSILLELSANNDAAMNQFLSAARQLTGAQQAAQRAKAAISALKGTLSNRKQALAKLIAQQHVLLVQLTPVQQAATGPGSPSKPGKPPVYHGATNTQAGKAVAFAFGQIGKPYAWGGTGPGSFDCSGLTMASWAYAGVSIPRISYDQMSGIPSVPLNNLQPGDILGFAGNSHVGLYVGGGKLIDAPQTGQDVQEVSLSGWYRSELDGAVRP